jgi:hypothetical protein
MTGGADQRLQIFVLLSTIPYVISSEVEESLALKSRTWRAITIFGSIL